jgi:hypothetical protein
LTCPDTCRKLSPFGHGDQRKHDEEVAVDELARWWDDRPGWQKAALGVSCIAVAGAAAYAVVVGGAVVVSGQTIIAIGGPASILAKRIRG